MYDGSSGSVYTAVRTRDGGTWGGAPPCTASVSSELPHMPRFLKPTRAAVAASFCFFVKSLCTPTAASPHDVFSQIASLCQHECWLCLWLQPL